MTRKRQPTVYIMASKQNGTLYTGVTSDPMQRINQHKTSTEGFTAEHDCKLLVWYELYEDMTNAITREKQIKAGSRAKKLALIETTNPDWNDLYETIL